MTYSGAFVENDIAADAVRMASGRESGRVDGRTADGWSGLARISLPTVPMEQLGCRSWSAPAAHRAFAPDIAFADVPPNSVAPPDSQVVRAHAGRATPARASRHLLLTAHRPRIPLMATSRSRLVSEAAADSTASRPDQRI